MPKLSKKLLSSYIRSGCEKQLKLYMYDDAERSDLGMPRRDDRRSGLTYVTQAGDSWQTKKVLDLRNIFQSRSVHINPSDRADRPPEPIPLADVLPVVEPYNFIIEGAFDVLEAFEELYDIQNLRDNHGNEFDFSALRPDILQVLPSRFFDKIFLPNGTTATVSPNDERCQLRVIDIKLSSEPGAHYFAEITLYSVALAVWLRDEGFDEHFVVAARPAVWPGSYADSKLSQQNEAWHQQGHRPTEEELTRALEGDLEEAVLEVFLPRIRRFFEEELADIAMTPWDALPYHVDMRCAGCEFLGYPGWERDGQTADLDNLCWLKSEREDRLCKVYGLSEAMSKVLNGRRPNLTASDLAVEDADSQLFDEHRGLERNRYLLPARATVLTTQVPSLVRQRASTIGMPKFPALQIFVFWNTTSLPQSPVFLRLRLFGANRLSSSPGYPGFKTCGSRSVGRKDLQRTPLHLRIPTQTLII